MSELEAEVKRIAELHAQQIQGNHKEWLEMFNDQAFIAAAPQMASLIAKLWAEREQQREVMRQAREALAKVQYYVDKEHDEQTQNAIAALDAALNHE